MVQNHDVHCSVLHICRKEFVEGCKAIKADSLKGICSRFSCMLLDAQGEENFKDLYRFTFQFGLDAEEGQRSLQRDIAIALWRLVFTQDSPAILERWLDFLAENPSGVRGISRDTWNMFLNFTQAIGPDLSNYSEDEAWPSLFDTFVEWELERRKKEEEQALMAKEDEGRCTDTECSPTTERLETEGSRGSQTWGGHWWERRNLFKGVQDMTYKWSVHLWIIGWILVLPLQLFISLSFSVRVGSLLCNLFWFLKGL